MDEAQKHETETWTALLESDITVAFETDSMHGYLPDEVAYLTGLEASPVWALRVVTTEATRAVRGPDFGHLSAKIYSDMVIVEDRPRESLEATGDPISIVKDERVVE